MLNQELYIDKLKEIDFSRLPNHVAFIMDGNRRWSKKNGFPPYVGHKKGFINFKEIILFSKEIGIKELSFFAFSKENWKRSKEEVFFLFDLMLYYIDRELVRIVEEGVRVRIIGDRQNIPEKLREAFDKIEEYSKGFNKILVNVMVNYSGQYDVMQAIRKIIQQGYSDNEITYDLINSFLLISSPDLLIRTGGEYRISNFILFQLAYTELYFSPKMWPDFGIEDLIEAIIDYQKRERRWGK
ncbi:MAG: polyprenyl diphosphate synthase [Candidatus Calescibacterium sp.]|nr:polyprenyl diphosphate synthase [Candidatus Calescibacterium sp.]MCX7971704.1 polyprenyl diphosphate synthase [bacterium]MDW8195310.1 polyprenyl diphosphate synthase [Candidatus Calescibacterium sp.]